MSRAALLLLAALLPGCQNSCQRICGKMASYAKECDFDVSSEDLKACREAQAGEASKEDRKVCRDFGNAQTIREEWTCEDLEDYFSRLQEPADTGD